MKTILQKLQSLGLFGAMLPALFLLLSMNANAQCGGGCTGFRTQTQSDWGATPCSGSSSSYMTTNFKGAFPNGITIGCGTNLLVLNSAQAVVDFLPSTGTNAVLPSGTKTNPGSSYSNMLAGQLVAAVINVGLDAYSSGFSTNSIHTGDLIIASGTFNGWTVNHLISEANSVIGGCDKSYSLTDVSNALNSFNSNYENGTADNHYVNCPPTCTIAVNGCQTNVTCNGAATGSITLTVTGANGTVKYLWNDGVTTQNRINIASGTYSVTATDAYGCTSGKSFTITQGSAIAISGVTVNNSKIGGTTGAITITVSGGSSPYKFLWSDGNINQNRTGLDAGNYSVTVTDKNGCKNSATYTITQPSCNINLSSTVTNVSCNGSKNGSISLSIGGCNGSATYLWNDGSTSQNRTGLAPGTYSVTVTDAAGCKATGSYSITQPNILSASGTQVNVSTVNGSNGSVTLTVIGGTSPYKFAWNDGNTNQNRTGLSAGSYSVTVTDAHGCSANASFIITQPVCSMNVSGTPVNVSCNNSHDASITLSVSGNQGAVSYLWNDGNTNQNRTSLTPSSYSVTATDNVGCKATASFTITQPSSLSASGTQVNVSMVNGNNGSVTLSAGGGTSPYKFSWNDGNTNQNRTGLIAGTYSVVVTDAHGCSASASFTITQPVCSMNVSGTPSNVSCNSSNDASITLNISGNQGAVSYLWNDGNTNQNRTSLTPSSYSVTATDNVGCKATASFTITQPSALSASGTQVNVSMVNGSNGSITLSVNGGTSPYKFSWNDGNTNQNRNGLVAGTYSVVVTDAHGCSANASFTITQPICAMGVNGTPVNVSCNSSNDASISLNINGNQGGVSYVWNDGNTSQNRTSLSPSNYSVTATDNVGCQATASFTLTQPGALNASGTQVNVSMVNGNDGSITLSVSGGTQAYSFLWNDGSTDQNRTGLAAGTYSVAVTDAHGCSSNASFTITQPICSIGVNGTPVNVSCNSSNDATISLNVNGNQGNASYLWSDGITDANRSGLAPGSYSVIVTDGVGCKATTSFLVSQPDALSASGTQVNVSMVNGNDGSITLSVSGGTQAYSFLWNDGSTDQNRTGLAAGTYSVAVTDSHGCSSNASFTITQPICSIGVNGTPVNVSCNSSNDATISLNVNGNQGNASYLWSDGITDANRSGLAPGSYSVIVTDGVGCSATTGFLVSQPDALGASGTQVNVSMVNGNDGSITLSVSGGTQAYSFLWNDGSTDQNRTGLAAGTYSVEVTDAHGCSSNASFIITQPICSIGVNGTPVNVSCNSSNDATISLNVNGNQGNASYLWSDGITDANRSGLAPGSYSVIVTDGVGCKATTSFLVSQPDALSASGTQVNVSMVNGNDGSITLSVSGGTQAYSFLWNDGSTDQNRTGLAAGYYSVTVTDAHGCSTNTSFIITQPICSIGVDGTPVNVSCNSSNDATISLNVNGNQGNASYLWSDGITDANRSGLAPGSYNVTVTDGVGCSATTGFQVTQPDALSTSSTQVYAATATSNDGSISVTVTGGTMPYTYLWNTGATTSGLSNIAAGTYSLTVTDAHGCTTTLSVTLIAYCKVKLNVTQPNCNGGNDGSATVTASGGKGPYTYLWNTGATTKTINAGSGTYSVIVTDQNGGCAVNSGTIGIKQPKELKGSIVTINTNSKICTGQAILSATGGTTPYAFTWDDGYVGANRTGLCKGNYNVTLTDANGCSSVLVVKIFIISGIADFTAPVQASDFSVSAFPNPTNGVIQLTINSGSDDIAMAYVYDLTGKVVLTQKINVQAGMAYQAIDLSHCPNGIYQLRTVDGKDEKSFKIILTK